MIQDPDNQLDRLRLRKSAATARGGQAFLRLLQLAETRDSGQVARIARFLATTIGCSAFKLDPFDLRTLGKATHDGRPRRVALGSGRPAHPGSGRTSACAGSDRAVGSGAAGAELNLVGHSPDPRRPCRIIDAGHGRRPALSCLHWPAPLS